MKYVPDDYHRQVVARHYKGMIDRMGLRVALKCIRIDRTYVWTKSWIERNSK